MFGHDKITLQSTWGVYAIINKRSGRMYIGSTGDSFLNRWKAHWYKLQAGKSDNCALQWDWLFFGPDYFEFRILESYNDKPGSWRESKDTGAWARHREAIRIAQSGNLYNAQMPASDVLAGKRAQYVASRLWEAYYGTPPPLNPKHDWVDNIGKRGRL